MEFTVKKKLIAVVSPAGGVGKSTLCKELGMIFGKTKVNGAPLKACIVDGNIEYGSQRALFNIPTYKYDITDWINEHRVNKQNYDDYTIDSMYTWEYMEKFFVFSKEKNVYLLLAPENCSNYDMDMEEADVLFSTLLKFFDVVIVDTANSMNGTTKAAIALSTNTFFVIVDDERCCHKMTKMRSGIVESGLINKARETGNIVYNRFQKKISEQYLEKYMVDQRLGFPLQVTIPDYKYMSYYNNMNQSAAGHNTPVRKPLLTLANKVIPEVEVVHDSFIDRILWSMKHPKNK